jgi:hypothetical protein
MRSVQVADGQVLIDGTARVLLVSSLFPFRVPRQQWKSRIAAVKRLGYDALDVYIPWNFHEYEPGKWDFTGQRDIEAFFAAAENAGLLVLARPGPYICTEWDGGGLPAWLSTLPGLRLRQNEPKYLAEVERWFDQVMPIIAAYQYPAGGPVVMAQLENELDFFDCADPSGYLAALVAFTRDRGVSVPILACAGQGDIARATGDVPDVVPAVNLYLADDSPAVEAHAGYYYQAVHKQGFPLLATETNRLHRTLKRLLVSGVKMLGPYLQASGWNPEYGTAVNNWGDVLGFMAHDYDFHGTLDPAGQERADAAGARELAHVIHTLGPRLGAATPAEPAGVTEADDGLIVAALDLCGGGQLLGLTNLADEPASAAISPLRDPVTVEAGSTLLILRETRAGVTTVTPFATEPPVCPAADRPETPLSEVGLATGPSCWSLQRIGTSLMALERLGIYRGAGRYLSGGVAGTPIGFVLKNAADIVEVRYGGWTSGWFANGGTDAWMPLTGARQDSDQLAITTRIWGHSNFDDGRLPSLRLGSLRGIDGVLAVERARDISAGWAVSSQDRPAVANGPAPLSTAGGWMSGIFPQQVSYFRHITGPEAGLAALHAPETQAAISVDINGQAVGKISPLASVLWLGNLQVGNELRLTVTKTWGESVGELILLTGRSPASEWRVERQDTTTLIAARNAASFLPTRFPVTVPVGKSRWIRIPRSKLSNDPLANDIVRATGQGLLITALAGETNLGRLWVGDLIPGAQISGGQGDLLLVDGSDHDLDLLLEATGSRIGVLTGLTLGGRLDRRDER